MYVDHRDLHILTHTFPTRRSSDLLIGGSDTDDQEGAWLEPGSLLGRVQPYLHEFAGARPEKPDPAQADRAVRGHGSASVDVADAGVCRRKHAQDRAASGAGAPGA